MGQEKQLSEDRLKAEEPRGGREGGGWEEGGREGRKIKKFRKGEGGRNKAWREDKRKCCTELKERYR